MLLHNKAAWLMCHTCVWHSSWHLFVLLHLQIWHLLQQGHLENKHSDKESEWFVPLLDLSPVTIKQEIKKENLEDIFTEYNIARVKETKKFDIITLDSD